MNIKMIYFRLPPYLLVISLLWAVVFPPAIGVLHALDLNRFFQIIFGVFVCFLWGLVSRNILFYYIFSSRKLAFSLLFVFIFFGVVFSPSQGIAALEGSYFLFLIYISAVILVSVKSLRGRSDYLFLGGCVGVFVLVYSLYVLMNTFVLFRSIQREGVTPGFFNIRLYSDFAVVLMPLLPLYVLSRQQPSWTAILIVFMPLSIWWWLLFITEARAGLLSLFLSNCCAVLFLGRCAKWPVLILSAPIIPAVIGWWLLNPLLKEGEGQVFSRDITSDSGRLDLWSDAIRYGVDNFPLGIGPMYFSGDGKLRSASAHNIFLNTFAEWGAPLSLMLFALTIYGFWHIYKKIRSMNNVNKPIYTCLVMAFVGVVINAQFSGSHIAPLSSLVMALAIGLVFGYRPAGEPPVTSVPVRFRATLLWAAMMLVLAYLIFAGLELYWLSVDSTEACFEAVGRRLYYPRFWAQGRLECMQMVAPDHWLFWSWRE